MNVVVLSASPEGQEVVQAPGELVTAVRIDSLEHTEDDPNVHGQDVEVFGDGAEDNRYADSSEAQYHDFDRRGVLSSQAEGGRVLVVDLVDVFVEEGGVHGAVRPVVPCVLHDEKERDLECHLVDAGEGDGGLEAEVLAHGVEHPDLGKLDGKVGEEDEEGALGLFPGGRDFVLQTLDFVAVELPSRENTPVVACSG
jgi:hypothetical protein